MNQKALDCYSSVKLSAKLALPRKDVKDFEVAAVMGTWIPVSGHHGPLTRGQRAVATTVTRKEREHIRKALEISNKTWQNKMSRWVALRLAHNCSTLIDCLFMEPLEGTAATCPSCRQSLRPSPSGGTDLPQVGETPSPGGGMSNDGINPLTSGNIDTPNKVVLRAGEEGGSGVQEQEEILTPALAQRELDRARSEIRRAEQEAKDLVHDYLGGDKEASA